MANEIIVLNRNDLYALAQHLHKLMLLVSAHPQPRSRTPVVDAYLNLES